MGQVTLFSIGGLRCRFYSDDHSPPHFHVERPGHFAARVFFLPDPVELDVKWGKVPAADRRALLKAASQHREGLLRQWETDVCDS